MWKDNNNNFKKQLANNFIYRFIIHFGIVIMQVVKVWKYIYVIPSKILLEHLYVWSHIECGSVSLKFYAQQ